MLPHGTPLPDEDWAKRHATIAVIALVHAPLLLLYALAVGTTVLHAVVEAAPVAALAALGIAPSRSRRVRELATTLALVSSSAALVHLSGGYIEAHFHFFVVVALVTLYQQWGPFLVATAFVLVHHGLVGVLAPAAVYNHPAALAQPWGWAAVHAAFITAASGVGMANWKLNELSRQRAERYYRQLYEGERAVARRIEEADRLKRDLVAAVSHEFRTPLSVILGFTQTLTRNGVVPPELVREIASRIHRQGVRLQQLVENLLEAEKPLETVGGLSDAVAVVETAAALAAAGDTTADTEVLVEVADDLVLPLAPEQAQLVVSNLVSNACKYADPGTSVTVRAHRHDAATVVIEVTNTGPPVPEHLRTRIFDAFVQADSSTTRPVDGVGLGLHIVHRIVTAADGRVGVTCHDGTTTFRVELPAVRGAALPVGEQPLGAA